MMGNIKTLSEASKFLRDEAANEFLQHPLSPDSNINMLEEKLFKIFKKLDQEINGYDE